MAKRLWLVLGFVLAVLLLDVDRGASLIDPSRGTVAAGRIDNAATTMGLARLPLRFEANAGQVDERVRFLARRDRASLFLDDTGATLSLAGRGAEARSTEVLTVKVVEGRPVKPKPSVLLPTKSNYYLGDDAARWRTNIPNYGRVTYPNVLDGVDVVYHGEEGQLEYDILVGPGADASAVAIEIGGARDLSLTAQGDLAVHTDRGELLQPKPRVFQRAHDGSEHEVVATYRLLGGDRVAFDVAPYDRDRELVIDPVLSYATYLGGNGNDNITGHMIASDAAGAVYVVGTTVSANFPTSNAAQPNLFGISDAFVAKLNPSGNALLWATYLGGAASENGRAIAVDAAGSAYVTGVTTSTNFPLVSALQSTPGGGAEAFITKLSAAGALVRSTYLGASDTDDPYGIAVDAAGAAYVTGLTGSTSFPVTTGAFQTTAAASVNVFVTKIVPDFSAFAWSTYLGGAGPDYPYGGIAVDSSGSAYVAGLTISPNFPITAGAAQPSIGGSGDAFVSKLNPSGSALVYSTFIGGGLYEEARGLAVDASGQAIVTGYTTSTNFPTANAHQGAYGGGSADAFVVKLSAAGTAFVYSSYLGGSSDDYGWALGIDPDGNAWVGGGTRSTNFPTVFPTQAANAGALDAFLTKVGPTGAVTFSTYFGGGLAEQALGIASDNTSTVHVAGFGSSTNLPTVNPLQANNAGGEDGFIARFNDAVLSVVPASANVPPRGTRAFAGAGGSGGYVYAIRVNASGSATIDAAGNYRAGPNPNVVDQVEVTDRTGAIAIANVNVGPGVSITPSSIPTTPPRGPAIQLAASGGSNTGFVWTMAAAPSGGTVDASGRYTPGPNAGPATDRVRVTDSLGNQAEVAIPIGLGVAITPSAPSTPPRGGITFGATGGSNSGYLWSAVSLPSGGSITAAGVYVAGSTGNVSDVVRVTDSLGNTAQATIAVGAGLAISPTGPHSTPPRGTVAFGVSGGSGTGYSWAVTTNGSGTATINAAGLYRAGNGASTTDVVTVTDSLGNSASASIGVGAGLTASPASANVAPRGSVDFDVSGGSGTGFVWAFVTNASGATLNVGTGLYTAGSVGSTTDVVRATDSLGNTIVVQITVRPGVSIAPANPSTPPSGGIAFTASGGSGTGFVWSIPTNLSGGTIGTANGSYVAGTTGAVTDVVRVADSLGNFAIVNVSVGGGLAANPAAPSTPPRGPIAFTVSGGSGTGFVWSLDAAPSGGSIVAGTGAYTAGATGNVTDIVRVTDSLGNTLTISVQVSAPIAILPLAATVAPLGTVDFDASGGSSTGLVWSFVTNASGGSLDPATGVYRAGSTGEVRDVVRVTDSLGNTMTAEINVTARLAVSPLVVTVPPKGSQLFTATGGAGSYSFSIGTNGSGGNVSSTGGAYTAGEQGGVTDVLVVRDANGATATATITVGPGITLTPATPSVAPSAPIAFAASGGSNLGFVFTLAQNGSGGTLDAASGAYVAGSTGNSVDVVTVTDSLGNTASVNVIVGGALAINPAAPKTPPRGTVAFTGAGGSGGYVWSLEVAPSGATIDAATGVYVAGAVGNVTDVVEVTDSVGVRVKLNVEVGPPLTLGPPTSTVAPGTMLTFSLTGGSGKGYVLSLEPNASSGSISAEGVYLAGAKAGTDTVKAIDDLGNSASAIVNVVAPPPPPSTTTPPSHASPDAGAFDPGAAPVLGPVSLGGGGCGCSEVGSSSTSGGWLAGAALALALVVAKRRRQKPGGRIA
jgi:hypothetical protein